MALKKTNDVEINLDLTGILKAAAAAQATHLRLLYQKKSAAIDRRNRDIRPTGIAKWRSKPRRALR